MGILTVKAKYKMWPNETVNYVYLRNQAISRSPSWIMTPLQGGQVFQSPANSLLSSLFFFPQESRGSGSHWNFMRGFLRPFFGHKKRFQNMP